MKVAKLKVNSKLYDEGMWVDKEVFPNLDDLRLYVCAMDSRAARTTRAELLREMPREERMNMNENTAYALDGKVIARAVLKDWAGFEEESGPIPFSIEAAEKYLVNPDYRAFKDMVVAAAIYVQAEASVDLETAAKN
jgi:hypothetical protein